MTRSVLGNQIAFQKKSTYGTYHQGSNPTEFKAINHEPQPIQTRESDPKYPIYRRIPAYNGQFNTRNQIEFAAKEIGECPAHEYLRGLAGQYDKARIVYNKLNR
jgi:hypothetical protein